MCIMKKRTLSKFELAVIGFIALDTGGSSAFWLYRSEFLANAGMPATVGLCIISFFLCAWIGAQVAEALTLPILVWVGKCFSRAQPKQEQVS